MDSIYNDKRTSRKKLDEHKEHENEVITIGSYDYILLVAVIFLVLIGVVMVFSSSYYLEAVTSIKNPEKSGDIFKYLKRQGLFAILGFCVMMIATNFNYKHFKKMVAPIYGIAVFLQFLVLLVGDEINGQKRWFDLGIFGFQPSEITKIAVIISLAFMFSKYREMFKTFGGYIAAMIILMIPVGLIGVADGATAMILAVTGAGLIFIVTPHTIQMIVLGVIGIFGGLAYLIFFTEEYRLARFTAWIDPFADPINTGYQTIQSLYAVASGGLFGLGLGQSRQKLGFVPEPQNDMIFAIVCEELGFFGASLILLLFITVVWRGIKIAINTTELFGTLLAAGIVIVIAVQAMVNIGVSTNTIPNTGVTLPFISYGGTSLIILMGMVGILLNISRYSKD